MKGCSGTAKHPPSLVCTLMAQQGQNTTSAALQGMISGLSVRTNWTLITLKLDARGSGLLGTVPGIKRKVTKQWNASRQHPGLHSSAPERNILFGYMGKDSHFIRLVEKQETTKQPTKHLQTSSRGQETDKTKERDPSLSKTHAHGKALFFLQQQPEKELEKANFIGNQQVSSKNQQGKQTHWSKQEKHHPQHSS